MLILSYLKRGFCILKKEGSKSFIKQFIGYLGAIICEHKEYNLYEVKLDDRINEFKIKVNIDDYEVQIIQELAHYESLVKNNYHFDGMIFEHRLKKGAIAFCLFNNDKEIAHVTWIAFNEEAKKNIDHVPYDVNFEEMEVCQGASFTNPSHRGKGFCKYIYTIIYSCLRKRGIKKVLLTIDVRNISSRKAMEYFEPTIIGVLRYTKYLWWCTVKMVYVCSTGIFCCLIVV
jgi:RimJ/RimL family protein N-acetyltransferase